MHAFDYLTPATIGQALDVLAEHRDEAKVLAGGQSLVPLLNYRLAKPRVVVDINTLPLNGVSVAGDRLRIGALTRHATLEESAELARACPLLREAAVLIGNVRVRTLGTLGGSLAHADPAAELPMAMVALDARFDVAGRGGGRTIAARDFFTGYLTSALAPDELLIDVELPVPRDTGWAVEELSRRAGDFAIVAVAALIRLDARGRVDDARMAFGGVGPTPVRVAAAEDLLLGAEPTPERLGEAADAARDALNPESDAFVSGAYRGHLAGVLARRALARAVARAMAADAAGPACA
jgi:aerobic carbon-monoxide dehydrogenase medium subunit